MLGTGTVAYRQDVEPDHRPVVQEGSDVEEVVRAHKLIEQAIRARWEVGLLTRDADGVFSAFLGVEHIERLMKGAPRGRTRAALEDFCPAARSPLGALMRRLHLSPSEVDLLAVLLACEIDPVAARLVAYLGGNQSQFSLSMDLLFEIVYRCRGLGRAMAAQLHRDLGPQQRLRRLRYVLVDGTDNQVLLAQCVRLAPRLLALLLGEDGLDSELSVVARLCAAVAPEGECEAEALREATAALAAPGRLLFIEGPPQTGHELLVQLAAAALGAPLLLVQGRGLGADRLVATFREASLRGALLALQDAEEALAGEVLGRFQECLEVFPGTVTLLRPGKLVPRLQGLRPTSTVTLRVPPHGERLRLWSTYLGPGCGLPAEDLRRIASLLNLGTAGIVQASHAARELAAFCGDPVRREHVTQAVRQLFDADLTSVAARVEVTQSWEDLVLPEDVGEAVGGVMARIRHRENVLGEWGFARKLGKGLGQTLLFSGEPGTGKSMVAGLIAKELGLDLYVVDLSRITSKWLGETEKNLARAFDAAEAGHVLLLFDEADSVLGKRSAEIRSANDRHANLETNFILARLEQFQGVAVFTSNLPSAIDAAVLRRMTVHIQFPFPEAAVRAELWRRMLPEQAPVGEDVDFQYLAERYELSGGFIRNVVLRAAYAAAQHGSSIGMDHLVDAAELEYRERGCLAAAGG